MRVRITPTWRLATAIGWGLLAGLIVFSIGFILIFAAGIGLLVIPAGLMLFCSGMVSYGNVPNARSLARGSLLWGAIASVILSATSLTFGTSVNAIGIFPLFASFLILPAAIQVLVTGATFRRKPTQSIWQWIIGAEG